MDADRVHRSDTSTDDRLITLYQGKPFSGDLVAFADDGTMIELTRFENGIEHGPQYEWFPDGTQQLQGQCDRGQAVGEWLEQYPNGLLARYDVFNDFGELLKRQRWDGAGNLAEDQTSTPPRR